MRVISPLATIATLVASLLTAIGSTLLLMFLVRYHSATHELALIGAAMFAVGAAILWRQWQR
jgi:hypothetical protein